MTNPKRNDLTNNGFVFIPRDTRARKYGKCLVVFKKDEKLGSGTFGSVKLGRVIKVEGKETDAKVGTLVAIKNLIYGSDQVTLLANPKRYEKDFLRSKDNEVDVLKRMSQLVGIAGWHTTSPKPPTRKKEIKKYSIAMQYVKGQNADRFLKQPHEPWSESEIISMFLKLATSLLAFHQKDIIHRDISLKNVVINRKTREAQLVDVGSTKILHGEETYVENRSPQGTQPYMAPEIRNSLLKKKKELPVYSKASDIFALGTLFSKMLADLKLEYNEELKKLISEMTADERLNRPSINTVLRTLHTIQNNLHLPPEGKEEISEIEKTLPTIELSKKAISVAVVTWDTLYRADEATLQFLKSCDEVILELSANDLDYISNSEDPTYYFDMWNSIARDAPCKIVGFIVPDASGKIDFLKLHKELEDAAITETTGDDKKKIEKHPVQLTYLTTSPIPPAIKLDLLDHGIQLTLPSARNEITEEELEVIKKKLEGESLRLNSLAKNHKKNVDHYKQKIKIIEQAQETLRKLFEADRLTEKLALEILDAARQQMFNRSSGVRDVVSKFFASVGVSALTAQSEQNLKEICTNFKKDRKPKPKI